MKDKKLTLLMPLRSLLFAAVFAIMAVVTGKGLEDVTCTWSVVASIINILTVMVLVLITRKHGGYLKLINYEKGKTRPKQIVGTIILTLLVGTGGMYLSGFLCYGIFPYSPPMMIAPIPVLPAILNFLILPVSTALAEDSLYFGCGVRQISNKFAAVVVPAFFFALQHCFIPTLFDARYMLYRFLSFLPLAIILCINYRKNRNPLPIMIGHATIDLATSSLILLTSVVPGLYEMMCSL